MDGDGEESVVAWFAGVVVVGVFARENVFKQLIHRVSGSNAVESACQLVRRIDRIEAVFLCLRDS